MKEIYKTSYSTIIATFIIVVIALILVIRIIFIFRKIRRNRNRSLLLSCRTTVVNNDNTSSNDHNKVEQQKQQKQQQQQQQQQHNAVSTLIILGSGGHTSEILFMTKQLNPNLYKPIYYCKASTDTTSIDRLLAIKEVVQQQQQKEKNDESKLQQIYNIPRSREVGQSYITSILTTLYAFIYSFILIYKLQPELILCNGPGTCIPICFSTLIYKIFGLLHNTKIIFIESYCRVQTLSLTGKIMYYTIADVFIVHWKELHTKFPNSIITSAYVKHLKNKKEGGRGVLRFNKPISAKLDQE